MGRKFWLIYLHQGEEQERNEWIKDKFNDWVGAYRYFVYERNIVGMDVGWDVDSDCKIHIWGKVEEEGKDRVDIFKKFCFGIKKGDILLVNKKWGRTWVQAILEVIEDTIYIHNEPLPSCESYKEIPEEYAECFKYTDRISITKCLWSKWGINNVNELNFKEFTYDPKIWFQAIRKVNCLWYSESEKSEFNYSYQGTLCEINQAEVVDKIVRKIREVLNMQTINNLIQAMEKTNLNQIILYGPPGSGKTHLAKNVAILILISSQWTAIWTEFLAFLKSNYIEEELETKTGEKFKIKVTDKDSIEAEGKRITITKENFKEFLERALPDIDNYKLQSGESYHWSIGKVFVEEFIIKSSPFIKLIQFHPSYTYEDFVRGIEVKTIDGQPVYETKNRIFAQMCEEARANPDKKFVLIIDEINRANLPAVLGELIYALEYRGEPVETPYEINGDKTLIVPENLYIIGTMNTADRSVGHIDYAIRRRFTFYPVRANKDMIDNEKARELYEGIIEKIFQEDNMSPEFRDNVEDVKIGHTYFLGDTEEVAYKFAYQVIPLLIEYIRDGILKNEEAVKEVFKDYFGNEGENWKELSLEIVKQKLQ